MLDKRDIRRAFNKAARRYDEVAILQRQVADELLERLDLIKQPFSAILDAGCGTGYALPKLHAHYPQASLYALDLAEHMLTQARQYWSQYWTSTKQLSIKQEGTPINWLKKWTATKGMKKWTPMYLCADMESLGMQSESVDLIFSNLSVQWCNDLHTVFNEWMRVLKPGGMLMFSSLGPDTLYELRQSWAAVDEREHVHSFMDMHNVGDALLSVGFAEPVMDVSNYTLTYETVTALMRDLKTLGASNASDHKPKQLTGKSRVQKLASYYEKFRQQGRLPASYEVVFGHAWKPEKKTRQVEVAFPDKQHGET